MALTESNEINIGWKASDFQLLNVVTGQLESMHSLQGRKGTVVMFICNHCPYVKHVNRDLVKIANEYQEKGINFIAISSNNVESHPEDSPERMKQVAKDLNYPFPYFYDESQETAKEYEAACTPDYYLFDDELSLTYHGQLDDSRPGNDIPVTGKDLKVAMDALLTGQQPIKDQQPSIGCGIKWK